MQTVVALAVAMLLIPAESDAQWPQWGGPNRDFKSGPVTLSQDWPENGPPVLWRKPLGDANSAISVDDGMLYTMFRRGDEEVTTAIMARTGVTVWEHSENVPIWDGLNAGYGPGPHSTPVITGGRVYTVGGKGLLICLDSTTGKKEWEHDLWKKYGGKPGNRGYASSPMVYGKNLIVQVSGPGKAVMAFDLQTGDVAWAGGDFKGAYSSPIVIKVDVEEQLILFVENLVVGMNPSSGKVLWKHDHETKYKLNISTPIWGKDNLLFVSSAYDTGSRAFHLSRSGGVTAAKEKWYNRKMQIQHGTAVRLGDTVYGSSGGSGPSFLTAIDVVSGIIAIRQRGFSKANLIASGNQLVVLDEDGNLALVTAGKDSFTVKAKAKVLNTRSWTVPTLVGTTIYLRDREEIVALDLSP